MAKNREPDYFPIFLLGLLAGSILVIACIVSIRITPEELQDIQMGYPDFVTIMLTGVTVIITMLAVFIAILALWGYSQFQEMTETASANHLNKILEGGPFSKKVEDIIVQHVSQQLQDGELRSVLVERVDHILLSDAARRASKDEESSSEETFRD
ncbi:hypothetical protein DYI23_12880 [Roseibium polysiphoniae]|uniref:Uncharacterized protein n=1 Tax=Roseibium polysiphoniae TaxID=2571221 RepID=A0A944GSS2_9HYPH|nr:hypothetical protein [Roseibium polysiphoniae]MBS8261113.1 hypothetical protein [Roseibium polysiphoniae]